MLWCEEEMFKILYYLCITNQFIPLLQIVNNYVFAFKLVYIYFEGNKSYRGWVPVTCSRELPAVSAPAHAGLLAEGEDRETHLHPDPQRSQQDHEEPGQHRVLHPGTQVLKSFSWFPSPCKSSCFSLWRQKSLSVFVKDSGLICITSRTNTSFLPFV